MPEPNPDIPERRGYRKAAAHAAATNPRRNLLWAAALVAGTAAVILGGVLLMRGLGLLPGGRGDEAILVPGTPGSAARGGAAPA
ncbi:MAG: hypothetical protein FDZ70_10465, partial [Actinobacteria bacterium]